MVFRLLQKLSSLAIVRVPMQLLPPGCQVQIWHNDALHNMGWDSCTDPRVLFPPVLYCSPLLVMQFFSTVSCQAVNSIWIHFIWAKRMQVCLSCCPLSFLCNAQSKTLPCYSLSQAGIPHLGLLALSLSPLASACLLISATSMVSSVSQLFCFVAFT